MTHVFVAPHPDDVALSCGGLIASLRELGQNVTILTVFSGAGSARTATATSRLPARGARLRVEGDVAGHRGVQPRRTSRPTTRSTATRTCSPPGPPRTTGSRPPRPTPTPPPSGSGSARRGIAGRASATSRSPASRSWTTLLDPGRGADRRARRRGRRRRRHGPAPARGRALRRLRRGVDRLPRPARRGLPRLRERRGAARARRATTTPRRSRSSAARSPGSSRRRSTCRSAIGNHVDHQLCRDVGVRLLGEGRRWVMPGPEYAGIVTFYEDFPYAWWNDFKHLDDLPPDRVRRPAAGDRPDARVRRHRRPARAEDHRHQPVRVADRPALHGDPGDGPPGPGVRAAGRRSSTGSGGVAERYWSTVAS